MVFNHTGHDYIITEQVSQVFQLYGDLILNFDMNHAPGAT